MVAVLAACAPDPGTGGPGGPPQPTTWLILAGHHESTGETVALTTADTLSFSVQFDDSAAYTSIDPVNQYDWNKLRGMSDCGNLHQTDSARFGWRWTGSAIELAGYTYTGTVRSDVSLGLIQPNTTHELSLVFDGAWYRFVVDGVVTSMPRNCTASALVKYGLWPYFGGDEVAPHDITIDLLEH